MIKLNWQQILACAVAGIVGGLSVKAIMSKPAVWAGFVGISAGEWLQAAAAIVGVFLTIQGTLWLEERKRQNYRVRSYNLWNSLSSIDIIHAIRRERITNEEHIVRGNHVTEAVLAICREKIEEYAGELIQPVDAASEALVKERS